MRALALAWLAVSTAGCAAGAFACTQSDECGSGGLCEANGFCSFPDGECASGHRYGTHAPSGIAGTCVEPVELTTSGAPSDGSSTGTTRGVTTLEGDGPTSAGESTSSTSTTASLDTTGVPSTDEGSSSGGGPTQIGPIVIAEDLDDGAMWPGVLLVRMGAWLPSGEDAGQGFCGEYPSGQRYYAYLRFELPEALPAGTTIASATLELYGHAIYMWNDSHALRVWAQHSDDAPQITGLSDYPGTGNVELGDLSVRWADSDDSGLAWMIPGPNASPDLAAIVQELVDANVGLAAGAHIQLWVAEDQLGGEGEEVGWLDASAGAETAARLTLTIE